MHEFTHVLRRLIRKPRLSLAPLLTLALAFGGSGALLSLFDALVLRQLAVPQPDRLVALYPALGEALLGIPMRTLVELRDRQNLVTGLCGYARGALDVEIRGVVASHPIDGLTGGCYQMLGVQPHLGRLLDERDAPDFGEPAPVIVISYRTWTRAFGSDVSIVGQTLRAQGVPLTIIGVASPSFDGVDADQAPDMTVSLGLMAKLRGGTPESALALRSIGRLRENTTLAEARAQLREMWPRAWTVSNPALPGRQVPPAAAGDALRVESIARGFSVQRDLYETALSLLLALAGMLLLLACCGIGALLVARTVARDNEFAVRLALGASHTKLAALVALEGVMVGVGAAVAAVPIAWWTSRAIAAAMWTRITPTTMDVTPDGRVLAAVAGMGLGAGIMVSLPAIAVLSLRVRRLRPARTHVVSAPGTSWQGALVITQFAVSLVLLFCAGLFARNLSTIRSIDPGYDPGGLQWARLELIFGRPRNIDQAAYFRPVLDQIETLPGVDGAALSLGFPTTELRQVTARVPFLRADDDPDSQEVSGTVQYVSPGWFSTVGVQLLQGREFAWSDAEGGSAVAVINRTLASRLFPAGDAIGARLRSPLAAGTSTFTIVGVAEDSSPGDVRIRDLPIVYVSLLQNPRLMAAPMLIVRGKADAPLAEGFRRIIEPLGRHRMMGLQTIAEQANRFLVRERVLAGLSAAFAGLSVLVCSIGLYALLTEAVVRRRREVGVRLALGATRASVVARILRQGLILAGAGMALGLPVALAADRAARPILSELSAPDAALLLMAMLAIVGVGLFACGWPAWQATRVAPADALRHD